MWYIHELPFPFIFKMKYKIKNNRDFKERVVSLEVVINNIKNLKKGGVIEIKR